MGLDLPPKSFPVYCPRQENTFESPELLQRTPVQKQHSVLTVHHELPLSPFFPGVRLDVLKWRFETTEDHAQEVLHRSGSQRPN